MDQGLNRIPDIVKKVHITAVCGTGMGALACMLKELGLEVTGSDHKVYPAHEHLPGPKRHPPERTALMPGIFRKIRIW